MEEGKKKIIMIGIIVVCIVAAVIITVATRSAGSGGVETIPAGEMTWIKCRDCGNTWQMEKREYFRYIQENRLGMTVPGIVCPKCQEEKGYRAEKCPKCGFIFERGSVPNDLMDRCPECGYSAQEELRKKARGEEQPPAEPAE